MPCHNAAPFIAEAIRSVLDQDYAGELEILVVDDGSTDDSVRLASSFSSVRVLTQANQGPAAARNLALQHARGTVIAFLDADDQWLPGSLKSRVDCLLANPEVGVVFANFSHWTPNTQDLSLSTEVADCLPASVAEAANSGWLFPEILLDPIVCIITALVRREVFDAVGTFDPQLRVGEDYDLWIRIAQRFRFHRMDQVVARYRHHAACTTRVPRTDNTVLDLIERSIREFGLVGPRGTVIDRHLLGKRLHRMCFDHAYGHFWRGDARVAAEGFRLSLRHDPFRAKAWIYALLAAGKASLPQANLARRQTT